MSSTRVAWYPFSASAGTAASSSLARVSAPWRRGGPFVGAPTSRPPPPLRPHRARGFRPATQQPPGDDHPLDLVGALADDHQGRVPVVALDGELGGVAVPAV